MSTIGRKKFGRIISKLITFLNKPGSKKNKHKSYYSSQYSLSSDFKPEKSVFWLGNQESKYSKYTDNNSSKLIISSDDAEQKDVSNSNNSSLRHNNISVDLDKNVGIGSSDSFHILNSQKETPIEHHLEIIKPVIIHYPYFSDQHDGRNFPAIPPVQNGEVNSNIRVSTKNSSILAKTETEKTELNNNSSSSLIDEEDTIHKMSEEPAISEIKTRELIHTTELLRPKIHPQDTIDPVFDTQNEGVFRETIPLLADRIEIIDAKDEESSDIAAGIKPGLTSKKSSAGLAVVFQSGGSETEKVEIYIETVAKAPVSVTAPAVEEEEIMADMPARVVPQIAMPSIPVVMPTVHISSDGIAEEVMEGPGIVPMPVPVVVAEDDIDPQLFEGGDGEEEDDVAEESSTMPAAKVVLQQATVASDVQPDASHVAFTSASNPIVKAQKLTLRQIAPLPSTAPLAPMPVKIKNPFSINLDVINSLLSSTAVISSDVGATAVINDAPVPLKEGYTPPPKPALLLKEDGEEIVIPSESPYKIKEYKLKTIHQDTTTISTNDLKDHETKPAPQANQTQYYRKYTISLPPSSVIYKPSTGHKPLVQKNKELELSEEYLDKESHLQINEENLQILQDSKDSLEKDKISIELEINALDNQIPQLDQQINKKKAEIKDQHYCLEVETGKLDYISLLISEFMNKIDSIKLSSAQSLPLAVRQDEDAEYQTEEAAVFGAEFLPASNYETEDENSSEYNLIMNKFYQFLSTFLTTEQSNNPDYREIVEWLILKGPKHCIQIIQAKIAEITADLERNQMELNTFVDETNCIQAWIRDLEYRQNEVQEEEKSLDERIAGAREFVHQRMLSLDYHKKLELKDLEFYEELELDYQDDNNEESSQIEEWVPEEDLQNEQLKLQQKATSDLKEDTALDLTTNQTTAEQAEQNFMFSSVAIDKIDVIDQQEVSVEEEPADRVVGAQRRGSIVEYLLSLASDLLFNTQENNHSMAKGHYRSQSLDLNNNKPEARDQLPQKSNHGHGRRYSLDFLDYSDFQNSMNSHMFGGDLIGVDSGSHNNDGILVLGF